MRKYLIILFLALAATTQAQYVGLQQSIANQGSEVAITGRKQLITIDNTKVSGAINLTDYPMLITLDYLDAEIVDNGSNSALNGGGDLRFYSDANLTNRLSCEIVSFVTNATEASRECIVWVKIPTVSHNTDTNIYVSYDNGETAQPAVGATYGRNSVWGDYEFVSHDSRNTDSSGNLTPTKSGTPASAIETEYGGVAYEYNASTEYTAWPYSVNLSGGVTMQYSMHQTASSTSVCMSVWTGSQWVSAWRLNSNDFRLGYNSGTGTTTQQAQSYENISGGYASRWAKVDIYIADFSAINSEPYIDGTDDGTGTSEINWAGGGTNNNEICIGQLNSQFFGQNIAQGYVSDARLRTGELTLEWCATEYENQYNSSTFASAGTPISTGN